LILFSEASAAWADPRLVYAVAIAGIILLVITVWLFRRSKRDGRAAGTICLVLSVGLHGALVWLVPYQAETNGGSSTVQPNPTSDGVEAMTFSTFDPDLQIDLASGDGDTPAIEPLPVAELDELLTGDAAASDLEFVASQPETVPPVEAPQSLLTDLKDSSDPAMETLAQELDSSLDQLLLSQLKVANDASEPEPPGEPAAASQVESLAAAESMAEPRPEPQPPEPESDVGTQASRDSPGPATARAAAAIVPGAEPSDFANRIGAAKQAALMQTGGDAQTEAAVQAALRFLAAAQRPDGAWDPRASGAGVERRPLGEERLDAGKRCTSGLTGLSLLAMMGTGNTHLQGDYADSVYRGLAYLIQNQNPDGSLGGDATIYAASYCHSMASLSLCEAAVMTQDRSAIESSKRAIAHTTRMQHPVTGGWRYVRGDPGDLSQLGWQAMVLDAGKRAGIDFGPEHLAGVARFLRRVRGGRGGLATYRPGEAVSRTMTAEALATRLLIGEAVPQREIDEAERYLLEELPGTRQDNYYYWYYATLALHQQQDEAWRRWNTELKKRLLATQRPDGSWPASTVWGGYGGTVYTTAMATLCLEAYYRHALRDPKLRIATGP
jgi:hypothetical protein